MHCLHAQLRIKVSSVWAADVSVCEYTLLLHLHASHTAHDDVCIQNGLKSSSTDQKYVQVISQTLNINMS